MAFFILVWDVDDCVSHECRNDGVCQDGDFSYTCLCNKEKGVLGDRCQCK